MYFMKDKTLELEGFTLYKVISYILVVGKFRIPFYKKRIKLTRKMNVIHL